MLDETQLTRRGKNSGQYAGWTDQWSFKLDMVREGGVFPSKREEPGNTVTFGNGQEKPQIWTGGIQHGSSNKVTGPIAQLKHLHINTRSMVNK